jgi:hypothetical protein
MSELELISKAAADLTEPPKPRNAGARKVRARFGD